MSLQEKVTPPEAEHRLDRPIKGGFCATIAVEWVAETPLLIGSGEEETGKDAGTVMPMALPGAGYVLPGASLRGLVRSAVEIVSLGRLGAANLHFRYGIRDFDHPWYKEQDVSKVDMIKAGWLTLREDGGETRAYITPIRDWAQIELPAMLEHESFRRAARDRADWLNKRLKDKYEAASMSPSGRPSFTNKTSRPFTKLPEERGRAKARLGGQQRGWLVFSGPLPGRTPNKMREYVFFEDAHPQEPVALAAHVWETFERLHSKPSKNRPEPDGSWAILSPVVRGGTRTDFHAPISEEAEEAAQARRVPIFYVGRLDEQDSPKFAFGLTRLFKLPHRRAVADVLPGRGGRSEHDPANRFATQEGEHGSTEVTGYKPDFVDMLFGHLEEPQDALGQKLDASIAPGAVARKGRVAFSFAYLVDPKSAGPTQPVSVIQMGPRASFAPFYLSGTTGLGRDYSGPDGGAPQIAGRKRYIPRYRSGTPADDVLSDIKKLGKTQADAIKTDSRKVQSQLVFLAPSGAAKEMRFRGEIHLHNVTPAELGAILFALTHGGDPKKPYRHMLGRAKPFGAGQMRVDSARLSVTPNDADAAAMIRTPAADEVVSDGGLQGFCPTGADVTASNASHRPFLKAFVDYVQRAQAIPDLTTLKTIREFLAACSPETGAAETKASRLSYMELGRFAQIKKDDRSSREAGTLLRLAPATPMPKVWKEQS